MRPADAAPGWPFSGRPAEPQRVAAQGRRVLPAAGVPVTVRLAVGPISKVADWLPADGFRVGSVPAAVADRRMALGHHRRWPVESYSE